MMGLVAVDEKCYVKNPKTKDPGPASSIIGLSVDDKEALANQGFKNIEAGSVVPKTAEELAQEAYKQPSDKEKKVINVS